jgi:hypothetical protein
MHEIPAWQIDMLLAGLQADGGAFTVLPPDLRS